jgi:hypothetical protein
MFLIGVLNAVWLGVMFPDLSFGRFAVAATLMSATSALALTTAEPAKTLSLDSVDVDRIQALRLDAAAGDRLIVRLSPHAELEEMRSLLELIKKWSGLDEIVVVCGPDTFDLSVIRPETGA